MKDIKINDVFHATWKDRSKSNHCFEGLLVAKEVDFENESKKEIWLFDTYWGIGRTDNKYFKSSEVESILDLRYYCNLDDYDLSVNVRRAEQYYKEEDFILLHDQHACSDSCKYIYLKKGATKSPEVIMESILKKIENYRSEIRSAENNINRLNETIEKVNSGKLDEVYL